MSRGKSKSEKKFMPKLKGVIKRRHETAKVRQAKREREEKRAMGDSRPKKTNDKRYRAETDFDTGL
jgi:hypothetical protein